MAEATAAAASASPAETNDTEADSGLLALDTGSAPVDTPTTAEATEDKTADATDPARPEWLKDKYQTVEEQAKAYLDLEKKLGEGVPETYDVDATLQEIGLAWIDDAQQTQVTDAFK